MKLSVEMGSGQTFIAIALGCSKPVISADSQNSVEPALTIQDAQMGLETHLWKNNESFLRSGSWKTLIDGSRSLKAYELL